MDKVRAVLRVVWQQRFWVLTFAGVFIAALCWMMGAAAIQDQFDTAKKDIDQKFSAISNIQQTQFHGNDEINRKDNDQLRILRDKVMELWGDLYERQRTEVLKWPAELGPSFIAAVQDKSFGAPISQAHRRTYLDYIEGHFDNLLAIVKAKNQVGDGPLGGAARGGYGRGGGEFGGRGDVGGYGGEIGGYGGYGRGGGMLTDEQDGDYLVQWLDQAQVAQKMQFPRGVPSAKQVWVTQEDLWVYETLLRVIADTNKFRGATRPDNTAVRTILTMAVGQDAALAGVDAGSIVMPQGAGGEATGDLTGGYGGEREIGVVGPPGGGGEYGRGGGYGEEGGGDPAARLLSRRYVDDAGEPIEASDIDELPKKFRRLPMRMVLMMDAKYLPKVMIECANAPLPIEITRVRVNPQLSGAGFESGMSGGRGGYGSGYEGGGELGRRPSAVATTSAGKTGGKQLAEIELHGVVVIYNRPDASELPEVEGAEDIPAEDLAKL